MERVRERTQVEEEEEEGEEETQSFLVFVFAATKIRRRFTAGVHFIIGGRPNGLKKGKEGIGTSQKEEEKRHQDIFSHVLLSVGQRFNNSLSKYYANLDLFTCVLLTVKCQISKEKHPFKLCLP